jgi:hypothetical protein
MSHVVRPASPVTRTFPRLRAPPPIPGTVTSPSHLPSLSLGSRISESVATPPQMRAAPAALGPPWRIRSPRRLGSGVSALGDSATDSDGPSHGPYGPLSKQPARFRAGASLFSLSLGGLGPARFRGPHVTDPVPSRADSTGLVSRDGAGRPGPAGLRPVHAAPRREREEQNLE